MRSLTAISLFALLAIPHVLCEKPLTVRLRMLWDKSLDTKGRHEGIFNTLFQVARVTNGILHEDFGVYIQVTENTRLKRVRGGAKPKANEDFDSYHQRLRDEEVGKEGHFTVVFTAKGVTSTGHHAVGPVAPCTKNSVILVSMDDKATVRSDDDLALDLFEMLIFQLGINHEDHECLTKCVAEHCKWLNIGDSSVSCVREYIAKHPIPCTLTPVVASATFDHVNASICGNAIIEKNEDCDCTFHDDDCVACCDMVSCRRKCTPKPTTSTTTTAGPETTSHVEDVPLVTESKPVTLTQNQKVLMILIIVVIVLVLLVFVVLFFLCHLTKPVKRVKSRRR